MKKFNITKKQSEEIINVLYPLYLKVCAGDPEGLEEFKAKMEENIHLVIPCEDLMNFVGNKTYQVMNLLEMFTNIHAFSRNRKVWEKKAIVARGAKCFHFDDVYNYIPAVVCNGVLTMGTNHMHRFMYFLIMMGFFNYLDLEPCVPSHTMVIVSRFRLTDEEMADFVQSFDRAEDSYKNPEIIYTELISTLDLDWVQKNSNHPVLMKMTTTAKDLGKLPDDMMEDPYIASALKVLCEKSKGDTYGFPVFVQALGHLQAAGSIQAFEKVKPSYIQQGHIHGILSSVLDLREDYPLEEVVVTLERTLTDYDSLSAEAKGIVGDMVRVYHKKEPILDNVKKAMSLHANAKEKFSAVSKLLMEAVFND